jgi:hypothetical protein
MNEKLAEKKGSKYKNSGTIVFNTFQVMKKRILMVETSKMRLMSVN